MLEILIVAAAVMTGAAIAGFLLLAGLDIVLFLKLRSMFERGAPFVGY